LSFVNRKFLIQQNRLILLYGGIKMRYLNKVFIVILMLCTLVSIKTTAGEMIKIGVATVDITPKESIWLNGYASRNKPSEGVIHPIHAKAMAFEDLSGSRAVLVTTDLIGFNRRLAEEIADRVEDELGIPRASLMLTSSHTHTAPVLYGSNLAMFDFSEKELKTIADYTEFLKHEIFKVIKKSLLDLSPGSLGFGKGEAHVAINRRVFDPDRVKIGINPYGPTDNELPVLAVLDDEGNKRAVLFGYACHGTTLSGKHYEICGDYMGFTQEYLELAQPGVISLYVPGCGADSNPNPRGTLDYARLNGMSVPGAVADVLGHTMKPVLGPIRCDYKLVDLAFAEIPTAEKFRERLNSENPHIQRHARYFLNILEKGEAISKTYPYPVQVWRFGDDLTIISLGGEVVVDYALRLKRELETENLWTIGFANDVCGYIASARILYEGGYEADQSGIYYTLPIRWAYDVEERIVSAVHEIIEKMRN